MADLEHAIPVTPQTVFKIGSVSKQFLATGIMILAQDGRLAVDDPVAKHVAGAPESWRDITLRHFLTHTSGVLREGPAFDPMKVQPDSVIIHWARGYTWRDTGYVNSPEFLALRPSGAFLSTVLDLAKWDAALYEDRVLTKASRDAMWTRVGLTAGTSSGYGFGWQLDSVDGHWRVHHGGSLPGFRAEMARFPNDSLTVIVLTNADGAQPEEIARGVARIYLSTAARPANPR